MTKYKESTCSPLGTIFLVFIQGICDSDVGYSVSSLSLNAPCSPMHKDFD